MATSTTSGSAAPSRPSIVVSGTSTKPVMRRPTDSVAGKSESEKSSQLHSMPNCKIGLATLIEVETPTRIAAGVSTST